MAILAPLCRAERKRMQKLIQKTNDKHFARRLIAMLKRNTGQPYLFDVSPSNTGQPNLFDVSHSLD